MQLRGLRLSRQSAAAPGLHRGLCSPGSVPTRSRRRCQQQAVIVSELSAGRSAWPMQQRAVDLKHRVENVVRHSVDQIRSSPPAQAVERVWQPVREQLQLQAKRFGNTYAEFVSQETKRKWQWSRQMEQEQKFWRSVAVFVGVAFGTLTWEAIVPVSFFWAVAVPSFFSFVLYDRPILNPIAVAMLLILPYKFIPGGAFVWF